MPVNASHAALSLLPAALGPLTMIEAQKYSWKLKWLMR
jgi:hypothetical protein